MSLELPRNSETEYITATARKYFKPALEYAMKNKVNSVYVNNTYFEFDFENSTVRIGAGKTGRMFRYKLLRK